MYLSHLYNDQRLIRSWWHVNRFLDKWKFCRFCQKYELLATRKWNVNMIPIFNCFLWLYENLISNCQVATISDYSWRHLKYKALETWPFPIHGTGPFTLSQAKAKATQIKHQRKFTLLLPLSLSTLVSDSRFSICIGGSNGDGGQGKHPRPNFFHFHVVFGKNLVK